MRRRVFISVLGSAAIWQFAARAQKSDGVRRVGVIMGFAENDEVWQAYLSTFRQALQNLGWTEGRNIRFDYRFSGERSSARVADVAATKIAARNIIAHCGPSLATTSRPLRQTQHSRPIGPCLNHLVNERWCRSTPNCKRCCASATAASAVSAHRTDRVD